MAEALCARRKCGNEITQIEPSGTDGPFAAEDYPIVCWCPVYACVLLIVVLSDPNMFYIYWRGFDSREDLYGVGFYGREQEYCARKVSSRTNYVIRIRFYDIVTDVFDTINKCINERKYRLRKIVCINSKFPLNFVYQIIRFYIILINLKLLLK